MKSLKTKILESKEETAIPFNSEKLDINEKNIQRLIVKSEDLIVDWRIRNSGFQVKLIGELTNTKTDNKTVVGTDNSKSECIDDCLDWYDTYEDDMTGTLRWRAYDPTSAINEYDTNYGLEFSNGKVYIVKFK